MNAEAVGSQKEINRNTETLIENDVTPLLGCPIEIQMGYNNNKCVFVVRYDLRFFKLVEPEA